MAGDVPRLRLGGVLVRASSVALVALVACTSALVLAIRFSRSTGGGQYLTSTAVVMSELVKVCASVVLLAREQANDANSTVSDAKSFGAMLKRDLIDNWKDTAMLGVPGCLYLFQNNIIFIALSHLDAATFQVTYQLKILTTAMFSVILLGKKLSFQKWAALGLLFLGVALVQMPASDGKSGPDEGNVFVGLTAVLMACCSSAFAGVYFERIVKKSAGSLWLRNIQLGLFGVLFGVVGCYVNDGAQIVSHPDGFFQHYSADVVRHAAGSTIMGTMRASAAALWVPCALAQQLSVF